MAKLHFSYDLHDMIRHVIAIQVDKGGFNGDRARYTALYEAIRDVSKEELDRLLEGWSKKVNGRTTVFSDPRDAKILIGLLMKTDVYLDHYGKYVCYGYIGPGAYNKKTRMFESSRFIGHYGALAKLLRASSEVLRKEVDKLESLSIMESKLIDRYIEENIVMVLPSKAETLEYLYGTVRGKE